MKAIILAAGYSAGLYQITKDSAQALLPLRGKPLIEWVVDKVQAAQGISEILIVINQRFHEQFSTWLETYASQSPIKFISGGTVSAKECSGAIHHVQCAIEQENINDDIMVVGADNLFSFNLNEFVALAQDIRPNVCIVTVTIDAKTKLRRYGNVTLDDQHRVVTFFEKPSKVNGTKIASACLYFFPREKIATITEYSTLNTNGGFMGSYISWLIQKDSVYAFDCQGQWIAVKDEDSYAEAICSF